MFSKMTLRGLGLSTAIALASASFAAHAAMMPKTVDPVPGDASAAEMKTTLHKMGFTEVQTVEHSGDVYTTKAKWDGEWVDLRIDAKTGGIVNYNDEEKTQTVAVDANSTDDQIRDELTRIGYVGVGDIERSGNVITTTGIRDGHRHDVHIDTETGTVMYKSNPDQMAIAMPRKSLSADELGSQLKPLGYTNVRNVKESGNVYTLDAYKGGEWVALRIDAEDGGITVVQ